MGVTHIYKTVGKGPSVLVAAYFEGSTVHVYAPKGTAVEAASVAMDRDVFEARFEHLATTCGAGVDPNWITENARTS